MSLQVEKLEKNMAKLTIEVPAEEFDAAIKNAYNKNKNKFSIPGFRKGKAPLAMLEKMYGAGIFYEDAANEVIDASYPKAAEESKEEIVSTPEIKVTQIEKGKAFIYEATVALKPEVTLGEYKGVEVKKAEAVVTDEDVENELTAARKKNGRLIDVEDGAIEDGDNTIIDFTGYIDDKTFDGGAGTDYPLVIGSHSFIEGFEDQLIGKKKGETCDVNVTFPEDYHAEELKGKEAVFKCKINSISREELPELNDDFAKEASAEVDTVDELKAEIRKNLEKSAAESATRSFENTVIEKLIDKVEDPIPHCMFEQRANSLMNQFANQLKQQGVSMELYLQYTGMDQDSLKATYLDRAEGEVKLRLALEKITELEKLEVSDEDLEAEVARLAEENNMTPDDVKKRIYVEDLRADMLATKAMDLVKESAVATDAPAEEETAAATEE